MGRNIFIIVDKKGKALYITDSRYRAAQAYKNYAEGTVDLVVYDYPDNLVWDMSHKIKPLQTDIEGSPKKRSKKYPWFERKMGKQ